MTNHFEDAGSPAWEEHTQRNKNMREAANETFSKASETARDAGEKAKVSRRRQHRLCPNM